ncbi:MAG: protein translocase subunit SecDF, partial [Planctomycetia bacterium]
VALIHDVLVAVACLALSTYVSRFLGWALVDDFKISLDVVAALLTIVGFSINDTIVIFDRLRELRGKSPYVTAAMIDKAVNQTLSRTILTSGTALLATLILYLLGGQGIHAFAFTMLVGIISGSYSTIFIAAPIVLWLQEGAAAARRSEQAARSKPQLSA